MRAAIEVHGVEKTFRIPHQRVESLKERVLRPSTRRDFRELEALRDVSFDVHPGEFFGIVGRNGSGKSTLLKILASIYAADAGRIRVTGRLAPFIELGVGFNPEMTARENVVLNGVMMGLRRREAQGRLGEVLDFAELGEFADLKLKNYSSGMLVRLAFAVMLQSDAEILLIDEVLAVGDAAFRRKCVDAFDEMRAAGRTVVLVSHDMEAVERFCDRAMLLEAGAITEIGEPKRVADRYTQINFEAGENAPQAGEDPQGNDDSAGVRLVDIWLEAGGESRVTELERGVDVEIHAEFEGVGDGIEWPIFGLIVSDVAGTEIFAMGSFLSPADGEPNRLASGERVRFNGHFDNRLVRGNYALECRVMRNANLDDQAFTAPHALSFTVNGTGPSVGLVSLGEGAAITRLEPVTDVETA